MSDAVMTEEVAGSSGRNDRRSRAPRNGRNVIGAFVLTLIGNLVFVLHVSSYWQPVASGVILLLSVLASSVAEKAARSRVQ